MLTALLLFSLSQVNPAWAGFGNAASTSRNVAITSDVWSAAPVLSSDDQSTPSGSLTISSIAQEETAAVSGTFFSVKNFGTLALNSFTISQVVSDQAQIRNTTTVVIQSCSGEWIESAIASADACEDGTISSLLNSTDATGGGKTWTPLSAKVFLAKALDPGSELRLRVMYSTPNNQSRNLTSQISVLVNRTDVRSGRFYTS